MKEPTKAGARPTREERLAAALRENLKRRKAQARGRAAEPPQPGPPRDASPTDGKKSG